VRTGVLPGEEALTLALRPGGKIKVRVLGPDGQALKDQYPRVRAWQGTPIRMPGRVSGPTDASGIYELVAPAGTVDVAVGDGAKPLGSGTAAVRPSETVPLEIVLTRAPPKPGE
jgi:hypothetical protein